jgi:glutathione synthase/RimK-type ligase-like ATP-grasp enzyme
MQIIKSLKYQRHITRLRKTRAYLRARQIFPMGGETYVDDREKLEQAEVVRIEWPGSVSKPRFGLVRDYGPYPRWTKYRRFLENNGFVHSIYNLHAHDWIEKAREFDVIVGFVSSELWHLQEMREKYHFLESYLQKLTYPSTKHINLYEDKRLEAYICEVNQLPFARAFISYDKSNALDWAEKLNYPLVSKVIPTSGSSGVELIENSRQARAIIQQAFSTRGRKTHTAIFRQKNYVYFQKFIENDGYDLRCTVVGKRVWGYYRKVLEGDFRASGMRNTEEKRELPEKAMRVALALNQMVKSPILVVDMVHSLDGKYIIIEYSPICQMATPEQAHLNGVPGGYVLKTDGSFHFEEGRQWLHELGLREFLLKDYLACRDS